MSITVTPISEADALRMFNIDLGDFISGTNKFVDECDRIEGDELTQLYGINMLPLPREKRTSKVVDPSAMDVDELHKCQRVERADRVSRMVALAGDIKQLEADDVSITDLIDRPVYI